MAGRGITTLMVVVLVTIFSVLGDNSGETYPVKYDNVDVDEILNNPRLRKQYIGCVEGTGPCITAEAKFLKDVLPEVLVTKCKKCTEKQQVFFDKVITWFDENDKETWTKVVGKVIGDFEKKRSQRG